MVQAGCRPSGSASADRAVSGHGSHSSRSTGPVSRCQAQTCTPTRGTRSPSSQTTATRSLLHQPRARRALGQDRLQPVGAELPHRLHPGGHRLAEPGERRAADQTAEAGHRSAEYRPVTADRPGLRWDGVIAPASQRTWFSNYCQTDLPHLRTARKGAGALRRFFAGALSGVFVPAPLWLAWCQARPGRGRGPGRPRRRTGPYARRRRGGPRGPAMRRRRRPLGHRR